MKVKKYIEFINKILHNHGLNDKEKVEFVATFNELILEVMLDDEGVVTNSNIECNIEEPPQKNGGIEVGDYVLVKKWDELLEVEGVYLDEEGDIVFSEDENDYFTSEMVHMCGQYVKVIGIPDWLRYWQDRVYVVEGDWYLTDKMIKEVTTVSPDLKKVDNGFYDPEMFEDEWRI